MINYFKVTNPDGEVLTVELRSPEKSGFFVKSIEGLGPLKATINTTESLYSDGAYFNSARLNMRNLIFTLGFYNNYYQSIEVIRNQSYRFFPSKREILVEVNTDSRTGLIKGRVESNEPDIFSNDEGTVISVLCTDPFFYEATPVNTVYTGFTDSFEFPFENPSLTVKMIEFGSVFISTAATVFYTGDIPTGIVITIDYFGPVTDLSIHNLTGGQDMTINTATVTAITGAAFQNGDRVVISTITGNKYIYLYRAGTTYNILNALGTSTQWIVIEKGDNVITYTATTGISNVQLSIQHNIVYEGL